MYTAKLFRVIIALALALPLAACAAPGETAMTAPPAFAPAPPVGAPAPAETLAPATPVPAPPTPYPMRPTPPPLVTPPPPTIQPSPVPTPTLAPAPILPQIDGSTARIPIMNAIHELFAKRGHIGPAPLNSRTHGAWLNLASGKADIIFLVAPTASELKYFAEMGVTIEMKVYGRDGLVFMGNESNPVTNLTSDEIRSIYSRRITNWAELGGKDAFVLAYIRNQESGSQRLFESLVWGGYQMPNFDLMAFEEGDVDPSVTQWELSDDMSAVTESVLLNADSIGYNLMSYIDSEFANSGLKLFSIDGVAPSTENFASGAYPFLTTSYVAIRANEPENSPARQLYDWVGSEESRVLIADNSTLTVTFSESVYIAPATRAPEDNPELAAFMPALKERRISREELATYTLEDIGYLRNGVFALSGKTFRTPAYARYFEAQGWYEAVNPSDTVIERAFNDFQRENLKLLVAYEKELINALENS